MHERRNTITLVFERVGVDDYEARQIVRDHVNQLADMLDTPDGLEFARWEREMGR